MKSSLTVVIPTLNNVKGLTYLKNYFKNKNYDVVVVDNSKKNLGFAGGVNKGAKSAITEWLLVLNDDIEFKEVHKIHKVYKVNKEIDLISQLIAFAEEKKLDALSPILGNPDGKIENYGYKVLPYGKISLFKDLASLRANELDGITAACLLIKTSVFKKLGGFDESFFAYLEDVDFFLRFKKAGYKMGISDLEVLHNHMTTSKTMGNFKAKQDMINWWRLFFKHPYKFKFGTGFIIERMRNISGYLKATIKSISYKVSSI